jgi:signal transduction histidine kinase
MFLFRALRELLNNIIKHAKANRVKILLKRTKNEIRITVGDDGVGFASSLEEFFLSKKCFGLFNIRERMNHIEGELKIESSSGKGTNVTLVAPLKLRAKRSKRSMDGTKIPKDFAGR